MNRNRLNQVPTVPDLPSKQFGFVSSYLPPLPNKTNQGSWFLRLIHFPKERPEIAWDVEYAGGVGRISQIRFSTQTRGVQQQVLDSSKVSIEKGDAQLLDSEPLLVEVNAGICWRCINVKVSQFKDYHFLYFCDGDRIHKAFAENVRTSVSEDVEPWRRLINRVSGSALLIPRNH